MNVQFERRKAVVAALVKAAFDRFEASEGQPRFGSRLDNRRWWRHSQEYFVGVQPDAWVMPDDLPIYGWLDSFAEMGEVREAYAADAVLCSRVDTMMGTAFTRTATNFYWVLSQHVIEPIVNATRTYKFDQQVFGRIYREFESRFRAKHLHMIEFRPLNGFMCTEPELLLSDDLILRPMSDTQMSSALDVLAVPRIAGGTGVNNARVSRFDQWALMRFRQYPVVAGDSNAVTEPDSPADFPTLDEPSALLVTALRVVCGGSVTATRSMYAQADGEFPFVPSGTATLNAFSSADNDRPTHVDTEAIDSVRTTFASLKNPEVRADGSLQLAIRHLVYAGSRTLESDRLTDLMTSAEALFVKRANLPGHSKRDKIAAGAAALLADDPELGTDAAQLVAFMDMTYRARNAAVHGDDQPYGPLSLLSGQPTLSLSLVLNDAERITRRAVLTILNGHVARAGS